MASGEFIARHIESGQWTRVRWREGIIVDVEPGAASKTNEYWVAPPLFDLQVNGYAGVDFQQDGLSPDDLRLATHGLQVAGCRQYLLTLVTDDWTRLVARLRHLRALRSGCATLQHAIAGWHIEGPFLSAEAGFCGAHDPALMLDPTPAHLEELREITGADPVLITMAPERSGAIAAIRAAVALRFKVSLGHTNAPSELLRTAVAAGATGFTHLANGCPRALDRHDNILWRVFETPGLTVTLIPDGTHVAPPLFRLIHREISGDRLCYITDAMSAAGSPAGRYRLGRLELEVGADQIVRLPGKTNFAGSALQPIDGVRRAAQMLGRDWRGVWSKFSTKPREFMGFPPLFLQKGSAANFCLLETNPPGEIMSVQLYSGGQRVLETLS